MFGCNTDCLFLEKCTVKDHISNTKQEKGDHYYIQTRHRNLLFMNKSAVFRLKLSFPNVSGLALHQWNYQCVETVARFFSARAALRAV